MTAGTGLISPGVRCRVLVCFHARQRRQPLAPPALTSYASWPTVWS